MKKTIFTFTFLILMINLFSSEWNGLSSIKPEAADIQLVQSDIRSSLMKITIPGFYLDPVETGSGIAYIVHTENTSAILESGSPDLPKVTGSLLIPDLASMGVRIVSSSYREYEDILIAPSKGNLTRDIDPATVPFTYGETYQKDAFFPETLTDLRDPYIIRDFRGQTIIVYPFRYNPVTKVLRVYEEISIEVFQTGNDGLNPLIRKGYPDKIDEQFGKIYDHHFLNFGNMDYTPVEEQGNMLIISYGSLMTAMQDFVNWKKTIGIPVEMVDVATIGNSSAIKSYIANYYNTNGLTFVLLVGDAAQVPTSYASGDSDNNYSYIVGSDHYPDLFVGRFSAENTGHVETMVQRTIEYEQNPTLGYDWYTKCIGIASSQGPGDQVVPS